MISRINKYFCPLCKSENIRTFYKQKQIPVFNNVFYKTREEATQCIRKDNFLSSCNKCGFIFNKDFDVDLLKYNQSYENDRSYSSVYNSYILSIIKKIVEKYEIKNKKILEIGCGNGEFLKEICRLSKSEGIGFDPSYKGEKKVSNVKFIKDSFNKKYSIGKIDICIMRHLLEHIKSSDRFLDYIVKNIRFKKEVTFMVEGPDFEWIAKHGTYWDITYEHCNYFTKTILARLLKGKNILIENIFNSFSGQYIIAIGKLVKNSNSKNIAIKNNDSEKIIKTFLINAKQKDIEIKSIISKIDGPFTIWGVAGKGVIFVNLLKDEMRSRIPFLIDIDPDKQNKYTPGTGHKIMSPSVLIKNPVKNILVMNTNYYKEIFDLLKSIKQKCNLIKIT